MRILLSPVLFLLFFVCAANADLKIDFNSTTQDGGPHNQPGWQPYDAGHEVAADFVTKSYTALGATVSVTPSWTNTTDNRVQQMIDRGAGNDGNWDNAAGDLDLVTDWIGSDTRTGNGGNGDWDGTAGTPTYMTLAIGGLPAGDYIWTSFHHDTEHVHGPFAVWVSTDGGTSFTQMSDGVMTDSTPGGTPDSLATEIGPDAYTLSSVYTTSFSANGADDVVMRFAPYSGVAVHRQIWGMNGFILESQDPCFNVAPEVEGPEVASVYVGETLFIDVEASDDALPYIEGCNPADPGTGTPYGLDYQWSQVSGPAPVQFDPLSADVQDVNVVFQLPGTYELLLDVNDAPEGGRNTQFQVTVDVIRPLDGDIDFTGTVDFLDVEILAGQWLAECLEGDYCADLDHSGRVVGHDFAMLSSNWNVQNKKVLINEFVASNRNSLLDQYGESSDWIELYNAGEEAVPLGGWFLTDDRTELNKWPFQHGTVLGSGAYRIIFASGKNHSDPTGELHTNFAIEKSGGYLALVNPAGQVMHEYADYPRQERDISYGMWFSVFRYFAVPTPGKANEQAFLGFTENTSHSHSRGFYDEPFSLRIFCDTADAVIRYTLDGSEPTEQHGAIYDPSTPIAVTTTVHVRSVAFKPGLEPSDVTTHSYIFPDDVAHQPTDPLGWPTDWGYSSDAEAVVPSDYEMDPRVVNSTLPGYSVRDSLLDIPTLSISMNPDDFISDSTGIYANPQSRWERKCSIEYFFPDNTTGFQHDCKIEVHGNASRRPYRMQKHSLRLTFTSLYGPANLNYPLFGESGVDTFNQLVLRASFTDSWGLVSWSSSRYRPNDSQYIRDVWMKESLAAMGQPSSRGNFVHLYVNGLYFGIHNLTERLADDFFADHLGGEPEDWEINEDLSSPGSRWNAMMAIDPATPAGYAQIQEYLDVENFADYMLLHFYGDAEDWPHHNGYAAVNAVSGDGKFRFFVWDQEIVLDHHNRADDRIDSTGGAGAVFQNMRRSEEFRLLFADRVFKHCFNSGALSVTDSAGRYLEIANWIDKAIVAESARWGDVQMSTPYGNSIQQPSPLDDINHDLYPPAPHGPDYYFTREDSFVVERDNVVNNYIPAIHDTGNSFAIVNLFRNRNLYPNTDPAVYSINGAEQHTIYVSSGDLLTMDNPNAGGTIYYTLDGSDPRLPGTATPDSEVALVGESAAKKVLVPSGDIGSDWTGGSEPFDETGWTPGTGGVGYERGSGYESYISIDVDAMYSTNETCYIRIPFTVDADALSRFDYMTLKMRCDDAFAAYINGIKVYQTDNAPSTLTWNSGASDSNPDSSATMLVNFDISSYLSALGPGDNILAIHGLNYQTTSTDFLISTELVAGQSGSADSISENARPYVVPIALAHTTLVKSRVLYGAEWSALNEAIYATDEVTGGLRITEVMFHPEETGDPNDPDEEYIELQNISGETLNLHLVRFSNGIDFSFPDMSVPAGGFIVIVKNRSVFEATYPAFSGLIAGEYTGSMDNDGERIVLEEPLGTAIHDFRFGDDWRPIADGDGFSLTIIDADDTDLDSWREKDRWRASAYKGGSPGFDDSGILPNPGDIFINEVLAHSHAAAADWIELYNSSASRIEIGGWYLSDSSVDLMKYCIADGTAIDSGKYLVFYEDANFGQFSADPGRITGFALSENGDEVYLSSAETGALTGYREYEDFGASPTGVSFGRYFKKSTGNYNFVLLDSNTPGWANAYPKVGPIVISEIMYHPQSGDEREEYVELHNISTASVTLFDLNENEPWRFTDGIDYTFPGLPGVTIPAGGYLLIVKDVAVAIEKYGMPPFGVLMLGPYDGKLSNDGEKLELSIPGDMDIYGTQRFYIRADRVNYSDGSHHGDTPDDVDLWPHEAEGGGMSLSRNVVELYGNDPNNWIAAAPSPGE